MKILILSTSFASSHGGPVRSISRLAKAMATLPIQVGLWAPNDSAAKSPFVHESENLVIVRHTIKDALRTFQPDLVHDNGIWLPHHHAAAVFCNRFGIPRIVSTRGMLSDWARNHKRVKKLIAWHLYQQRDLFRANALHATSEEEASELRQVVPSVPVHYIPNGIELDVGRSSRPAKQNKKTLLFVGRIYPVKGLPMLLEAWDIVRPTDWVLRIVGPDEGGHLSELQKLSERFNLEEIIVFPGEKTGDALEMEYSAATALVLPSYSENFGLVVGEAIARGLPVLTTQGTPWSCLPETRSGWWVPATVEGLSDALRKLINCSEKELGEMGHNARMLAETRFGWNAVASEFLSLYRELVSRRA